ncbi:4'-phosphopantetheinyl transferase family protein [Wocania ichthyoenteri]|uniref:4'-phosphopantetheinyl transferase family protein n=1 Tax=Wocania ichthyoenteri TaxID=1230531 RepID=UPI00068E1E94|nr:4'-phosphopantetheinyl transferase superfamily protein [Wocania ichthyoenteri]
MSPSTKIKPLTSNLAHLWQVNFSQQLNNISFFLSLLSVSEKEKASRFRFKKDENQFIISRGVLRILSAQYLNICAKKIVFEYGEYGKPEFDFNSNLKFNISHSGDMAVLAFVLNYDIGADIEKIKDNFDVLDIASNYFSKAEIDTLKKLPKEKHVNSFYRCWTRKESFIKAKSLGLTFPLDSFSVCINSGKKTELLETKWDEAEKNTWKLFTFSPHQNYIGAVSIKGDIKSVEYFNFNDYNFIH